MKTVLFVWILGGVAAYIWTESLVWGCLLGTAAYFVVVNCAPVTECWTCDGKKRFFGMFGEGWVFCPDCDGKGSRRRVFAVWDGHLRG
jgi:hypothetical protein